MDIAFPNSYFASLQTSRRQNIYQMYYPLLGGNGHVRQKRLTFPAPPNILYPKMIPNRYLHNPITFPLIKKKRGKKNQESRVNKTKEAGLLRRADCSIEFQHQVKQFLHWIDTTSEYKEPSENPLQKAYQTVNKLYPKYGDLCLFWFFPTSCFGFSLLASHVVWMVSQIDSPGRKAWCLLYQYQAIRSKFDERKLK